MIHCKILNKNFTTKQELFRTLKENHGDILQMKKAIVKRSDPIMANIVSKSDTEATKGLSPSTPLGFGDYVYPVINTAFLMDSHDDVHIRGLWDKSAQEQQGKTYLIINHQLEVGKVISQPKDVEIMLRDMAWKDLGEDYEGDTQALIFKAKLTDRSNKDGFEAYRHGDPVEHSVRMQYVKIKMAINEPDDEDFDTFYETWEKYYPMIVNKERADERGYFFAVLEAKIFKEGSQVLAGSNSATPTLYDLEGEGAGKTTPEPTTAEPSKDTRLLDAISELQNKINV